jgi:hypothetical protein
VQENKVATAKVFVCGVASSATLTAAQVIDPASLDVAADRERHRPAAGTPVARPPRTRVTT